MPQSKDKKLVVWQLALSLHDLFDELHREGFREIHSPGFQLRAAELLNCLQAEVPLKYALASLICHSAEDQEKFYRVFDGFIARYKPAEGEQPPSEPPAIPKPSERTDAPISLPPIPGQSSGILPDHSGERVPDLAAAARSGPITIELRFREDGFRPWNLPELEPALRPFREKEWAESTDWDIPASIQKTMRGGGVPSFVRKQKRRAPQYLFLIQQKSVRDHLAAFYADLVKELLRRDVDADFYFYGDEPTRCWRDRRVPSSFTTLDRLFPAHKNSRLILVGEANGLLTPLRIYPSPLVFQLKETWRDMALLNTRSTALWSAEEETLCRLFPVAPANIAGLGSLFGQWESRQSFTPAYWKAEHAESVPPTLTAQGSDPEWVSKTIHHLKVYLGKYGITWLCAICVYPEIYWQMTKILHDEAISPVDVPEETRRNQIWHNALLQLSRLEWLRQGNIPSEFRQKLRNLLPASNAIEVRKELLRMLNWDENATKDKDSYAYQDREYTLALLQHEQILKSQPTISEAEKARLNADFRERLDKQGITVSDIADAVGRDFFKKLPAKPQEPGFWVLWIDDQPENNASFQEKMTELMFARFVTAVDTEQALKAFSERDFDLIVSDMGRGDNPRAGVDTLNVLRDQGIKTKFAFFTRSRHAAQYKEEMELLGVTDVLSGRDAQQAYLSERVMEQQGKSGGKDVAAAQLEKTANAVCKVIIPEGVGTGFLTANGYLFTCNHVLGSPEMAKDSHIEFEDPNRKGHKIIYRLDPTDFVFSPKEALNFTRIKVVDQTEQPLSQWGTIEFEVSKMPKVGQHISIIHHPDAGDKKVDFNALEVYGVLNENVYYAPKTRPGSSGAPILNEQFKAVAMHRQRRTGNDIFEVNIAGDKREASQGVLFRDILEFIEAAESAKAQKGGSESTNSNALAQANMHLDAGNKSLAAKDYPDAMEEFETAWGQFIQLEDLAKQAEALKGMGLTAQGMENLVLAQSSFEKSYDLYAKLGDKPNQSESLKSLSKISRQLGELPKAKAYMQTALSIDQMIGNWGFTMHELGDINEAMGELEDAEKNYREALDILEKEINDDRAWVDTQEALGRLAFKRGDAERAWSYYQLVLRIIEEESDEKPREADVLAVLAEIELQRNNLAQARQYAQKARAIYVELNDKENALRMEEIFKTIETQAQQRDQSNNPQSQQQQAAQSQSGAEPGHSEAEVKEQLSLALEQMRLGKEALEKGQVEEAFGFFEKYREINEELYAANPRSESLKNGLARSYEKLGGIFQAQGKLEEAFGFFEKLREINEELYAANPHSESLKTELLISYSKLGDIFQAQGKMEEALGFFEKSNQLSEELYVANPHSEGTQAMRALTYQRLEGIFQSQGKLGEALGFFEKRAKLDEELYTANPGSESLKDELAISYSKLGDIFQAQGKLEEAVGFSEKSNQLNEELYAANPGSKIHKTELAISYSKLGDIFQAQGKLEEALGFFEKRTKLGEELYAANPESEDLKNGLAISYEKMGDIFQAQGKLEVALGFFKKRAKLGEELYAANPQNVEFKNSLAISYSKLGDTHRELGNYDMALGFYEKSNELEKEHFEANPQNVEFKNILAISYSKLGDTHRELGNYDKALGFYEQSNQLEKELYEAYPQNVSFKNGLAISYSKLGDMHSAMGNLPQALTFFEVYNVLEKELHEAYPKNMSFKNGLAVSFAQLGRFYQSDKKDLEKAKEYFQHCFTLWKELSEAYPENVELRKNFEWALNAMNNK